MNPPAKVAKVAKVLTVSDGAARGTREDTTGPALAERLRAAGWNVVETRVVPDGVDSVSATLRELCAGFSGLVVTTGGTGFGPRDLTPEGTDAVLERNAPGLAEAIRRSADASGRGLGMLGRGVCGTLGDALVCNLPGSAAGATDGLDVVLGVAEHALDLMSGGHPH